MKALLREAQQLWRSIGLYRQLLPYAGSQWRLLIITLVVMFGTTGIALARPWPMQVIVDSVLGAEPAPAWLTFLFGPSNGRRLLAVAVALMVFAVLVGQAASLAQTYFSHLLSQRMVFALRCDLYAKLQRLSLRFHDSSSVGDLIYRITGDAAGLQNIVIYGLMPLVVQLVAAIMIAGAIFSLDARLGYVSLATVPLLFLWTVGFSGRVRRHSRGLAKAESELYTNVSEVLGSIRVVKSFGMEDIEQERFATRARASQEAYVRMMMLSTLGGLVTDAITGLGTAAVVFVGALIVLQGELTVGELLVFIAYLGSLYGPIRQFANSAMIVQRSGASAERVLEILDQDDEHRHEGIRLPRTTGRLQYSDVSFAYDERKAALQNVSFAVEPGEMVAFVGRSGAGKTTLMSLLLRFYEPQSGRIELDGQDIAGLDLRWLRQQLALVLQEPIIFSSSLGENIAYGRPGATDDEIVAASKAAGLHDFVMELPDGYETRVGERGVRLSGGQRQRLSIARAFLKDAPILILDEPTSNLDATTERHIFASLQRLAQGRTTLVIAHRLATVQRADRIIVLEAGRIVEEGTHDQLLAMNGAYAALCRDQMSAATSRSATIVGLAYEPSALGDV